MRRTLIKYVIFSFILIGLYACDTVDNSGSPDTSGTWLIPRNQVIDGGPGKDGIPALNSPEMVSVNEITYLKDNDLVLIYNWGNEIRIYPHPILDWHEIINDKIGATPFAITYCPLTGSGICWDRVLDGKESTFGVSGLLYNNNLIAYDRSTQSNWSQMRLQSVNGELKSTIIKTYPLVETSWETARKLYPNGRVVSTNTGYSRNYGRYPYGSYKISHSFFIFPVSLNDTRLNSKDRVLGVLGKSSQRAYSILDFVDRPLINEEIDGETYIIYGDTQENLLVAFKITTIMRDRTFSKSSLGLPYIIEDNSGRQYDIFG
jgi:hypothetical protein